MLLFGIHQNNGSDDNIRETLETILETKRDLPTIQQQASIAIEASQKENERTYNKKRKTNLYKEGEYVMIRNIDNTPGVNKKFIPKYKRSYVIKKILDHDRYIITDIEGFQLSQTPYQEL